jgi:hypothetical protein
MSGTTSRKMSNVTITSTSTPALNGTYATGEFMLQALQGQCDAVALNGTFADGTTSLSWPDAGNAMHTFSIAEFKSFAAAMSNYISLYAIYACGASTVVPPNTATIA